MPQANVSFLDLLRDIQAYMTVHLPTMFQDQGEDYKTQMTAFIAKFVRDKGIEGGETEELVAKLYREMAEFSILTPYLSDKNIEEININSWDDMKIHYADGSIQSSEEQFYSAEHALDVIRRLLHQSGMVLDYSNPSIVGHLNHSIRITAITYPLIDHDKRITASIRIVNPQKLDKTDFIHKGTATQEMLEFLSDVLRYDTSMCVTGSTGSGKTTLMSWLLATVPDQKRIFTIENGTREFDLQKKDVHGKVINNVIHTVTRHSDDAKQLIDQDKLLELALTSNPDIICVGEMKSGEAFAAQEAARTGHAVITTTHANSCEATYRRMLTLCRQKHDMDKHTLYELVTEAFPIVVFVKRLEDKSRKIMEITEMEIKHDGTRELHTLYKFMIASSEKEGQFIKEKTISTGLQKRLLENGMPTSILHKYVGGGRK